MEFFYDIIDYSCIEVYFFLINFLGLLFHILFEVQSPDKNHVHGKMMNYLDSDIFEPMFLYKDSSKNDHA